MIDTPTHPTHEEDRSMSSKTRSRLPASGIAAPAPLSVLPARLNDYFTDADALQWAQQAGPVTAEDLKCSGELSDMAVRATAHGQLALGAALVAVIAAVDALPAARLAA